MSLPINDDRLLEIYHFRTCPQLPNQVGQIAHRVCHSLLAAATLDDLFMDEIVQMSDGTLALHVLDKWFVTFQWLPDLGASDLALRRL